MGKAGYKMRQLGRRTLAHRMSMMRNMVSSLIEHQRIETTVARAKELRIFADRMVTHAKRGDWTEANRFVRGEWNLMKLFTEMRDRYQERPGGYTRILRTRLREGDRAPMCYIEYVDRDGELRPARPPTLHAPGKSSASMLAFDEAVRARVAERLEQKQTELSRKQVGGDPMDTSS
eukprot:CAMPEP_0114241662 /NCGR_PEP_ID=MMETSP0058-20121206/9748_1 /TAXON_ID=36894 /ORGANISM="Pyramimonas parkeae, CCMP726" /LENGTH=175 /DNA_ID=CAMNT_0001354195 /DNA_START=52 /DNA_END=579 /DNA_ORIENTATION=-